MKLSCLLSLKNWWLQNNNLSNHETFIQWLKITLAIGALVGFIMFQSSLISKLDKIIKSLDEIKQSISSRS